MHYICLRAADGKGIADYTLEEFQQNIQPRLEEAGVKISSLGSPIGKIDIDDQAAYEKQLEQLDTLCRICNSCGCRYIRMFSFWMPKDRNPDDFTEQVIEKLAGFAKVAEKYDVILIHENEKEKLAGFAKVAEKYDVILIHENEKDIYGDIARRCKVILDRLASPHFKAAFDFANFVQCGEDTAECWELLKEHVVYIHIKDAVKSNNENVLCGTGDGFDFANFVQCGEDTAECWELLKEHVVYIHIKDAVKSNNENVLCGTGDGQIPQLLKKIIREDGYQGFLTLEPHLVLFDTLQSLETEDASEVISHNKAKDGAEGYAMQYHALMDILNAI